MASDGLVPDDFDLDKARRSRSTTPPEDLKRCPYCGSTQLLPRDVGRPSGGEPKGDYYCDKCREGVDEADLEEVEHGE